MEDTGKRWEPPDSIVAVVRKMGGFPGSGEGEPRIGLVAVFSEDKKRKIDRLIILEVEEYDLT